ncbi:PEP-CTERM sorting domain-containing protein [Psychromonas sp. 14N.309.X.WAT.B.A12]|uniref:PEP-CTERM sorting domain-containing protein n=1 Tax=unclassified Psychromonas TaxID=2614957 RepID=UPI0025AED13A|nr:PEP-CTERM sorting domain-containing protein [Psychromonas sp. 14N.309.X.WAT.B.A12]MDN2664275.1 PEP-CTERM sorting domain-containing protein [Psychromonas sp. 14N.309.X.WAT.B.A12]
MNLFKTALTAIILLSSTYASAISFYSSVDDGSSSTSPTTTLTDDDHNWIDPTGTDLDGATWIQPSDAWNVDGSEYSFYELDLVTVDNYNLTSLFVSYDDELIVSIGSDVIFDSTQTDIEKAWKNVYDIFDSSLTTLITADNKLTFAVTNSANGNTGVIWSGTASVPEPSMLFVLGFALIAFAYRRKTNV